MDLFYIKHLELSQMTEFTGMVGKISQGIADRESRMEQKGKTSKLHALNLDPKEAEALALELSEALKPKLNCEPSEYMSMLTKGDRIYLYGVRIGILGVEDDGSADPLDWGRHGF